MQPLVAFKVSSCPEWQHRLCSLVPGLLAARDVGIGCLKGSKRKSPEHMKTHMLGALGLGAVQTLSARAVAACWQMSTSCWQGQCSWQTADECTQCEGVSAGIWAGLKPTSPEHMETHMLGAPRLGAFQALSADAFAACHLTYTSYQVLGGAVLVADC